MKAVVFDEELKLVSDYEKPVPKPGEVLIKTRMSGICNTDLEITKGYMGHKGVLGHEFVGDVVEAGDECDFQWVGKGSWAKSTAAAMMMNGAQNTLSATVPIVRLWVYGKKTDVSANILHFPLKIFLKYPTL